MANPMDDVFTDVASQLTGGLVTDMTTAIVAMVAIMVIMIGFDKLKDVLLLSQQNQALKDAEKYSQHAQRAADEGNNVMYRYYKKRSANAVSFAARGR